MRNCQVRMNMDQDLYIEENTAQIDERYNYRSSYRKIPEMFKDKNN